MVKKRHVSAAVDISSANESLFNLEDVVQLGGDKADYELLVNVDTADADLLDHDDEDSNGKPVEQDELSSFIKELGFQNVHEEGESKHDDATTKLAAKANPGKATSAKGISAKGSAKATLAKENSAKATLAKKTSDKVASNKSVLGNATSVKVPSTKLTSTNDSPVKGSPAKGSPAKPLIVGKKSKNKFKAPDVTAASTAPKYNFLANYSARGHLLVKPGTNLADGQFPNDPTVYEPADVGQVNRLRQFAERLLNDDIQVYHNKQAKGKDSEMSWRKTVLTSGTLSDKIAALTLMVQDSPIHNLASLDTLLAMANKKGKREALLAIDTLRELFLSTLLPSDRMLRTFDQHPLSQVAELASGNRDSHDKRLLLWYYEARLKERYVQFVKAVDTISHDTVAAAKQKALVTLFEMLAGNPEQEKVILSMVVNKLGDPDYKVAAKVVHLLNSLVQKHPNMITVIVREVETLLYRPNIATKAQYYAVCFLNQLILSQDQAAVAAKLINIYFSFFKVFVKKGEVDSKMLSALLTGVNRAYPFAKEEKDKIEEQVNLLYRTVHTTNFNTSVQTLMLLYHVMHEGELSDRYYVALYRKLAEPELRESARPASVLSLLYRSMRVDTCRKRVRAFAKRLLQVCTQHSMPAFSCASLVLLSQLKKNSPDLLNTVTRNEESDDDDDDEHFVDIKDEEDPEDEVKCNVGDQPDKVDSKADIIKPSWIHKRNLNDKHSTRYDPHHRNPLYCNAEHECTWELHKLATHYHPSVALFAQTLLKGECISYPGDPLQDFTLIRFLDRFVFRNPKKPVEKNPLHATLGAQKREHAARNVRSIAVNSDEYLQMAPQSIPVDERFLHRYFQNKASKVKKSVDDADSDAESVGDDEFDRFMDKYDSQFDTADVEFDFAGGFTKQSHKTKKKRDDIEDDESNDDDDDFDEDLSDEEMQFSDDEDFQNSFPSVDADDDDDDGGEFDTKTDAFNESDMQFDEEDVAFSDNSDLEDYYEEEHASTKKGKRKKSSNGTAVSRKKMKSESDSAQLFAAAEEFSHLIDKNSGNNLDTTGTGAMANKDNAHIKQLKWEDARDKWVHDKDWKSIKRKGQSGKKGQKTFKFKNNASKRKMAKKHKGK